MPATPAWPPASSIRLFVDRPLEPGAAIALEEAQAHYLTTVMRLGPGAVLHVFDDRTGEYRARMADVAKRAATLFIEERLRAREPVPDLWLGAAPIRRARYEWVVEKACELGVARIAPVLTRRAVVDRVNHDRLRAHMIEAAEQCGRTALPVLDPLVPLDAWLDALGERPLLFADEAGGRPMREVAAHGPTAILIGPEGGFDDAERALIRSRRGAVPISLGPRILRADTAAVAAVASWLALAT